jgi:hypothetical protein
MPNETDPIKQREKCRAAGDNEQLGRATMVHSAGGATLLPSILFLVLPYLSLSGIANSYFAR